MKVWKISTIHLPSCLGWSGRVARILLVLLRPSATEDTVLLGQVSEEDRLGNQMADEAPDLERRRVDPMVIVAWRNLCGVCGRWYPVVLLLHWFFIAIARTVVNHDGAGGTAPDAPMDFEEGHREESTFKKSPSVTRGPSNQTLKVSLSSSPLSPDNINSQHPNPNPEPTTRPQTNRHLTCISVCTSHVILSLMHMPRWECGFEDTQHTQQ